MKFFSLRVFCAFFLLLFAVFSLASCVGTSRTAKPSEVLRAMLSSEKKLPAGAFYTTESSVGAPDYMSKSLLSALYGSDEMPPVMERASCATYISSGLYSCEFAVFECRSERDTTEIADICLARIDMIRRFYNSNAERLSLDPSAKTGIVNAKVAIKGRYVIMALSDNAPHAIDAAKSRIG